MDPLVNTILVILLPLALAVFAYKKNLMTVAATVVSFIQAEIIGFCTDIWWVLAFFMFPVMAFIATKWRLKEKMELGLQEGKKGERSVMNLLGVGTIPVVIAIAFFVRPSDILAVAFLAAIAVSTSDTIASETGIWAKKTYMITTFKEWNRDPTAPCPSTVSAPHSSGPWPSPSSVGYAYSASTPSPLRISGCSSSSPQVCSAM